MARRVAGRKALVIGLTVLLVAVAALAVVWARRGSDPGPSGPTAAPSTPSHSQRSSSKEVYVDCAAPAGGDGSKDRPWASPAALDDVWLPQGATVFLKRGCSWDVPVSVSGSATRSEPIRVTAYGEGVAPILSAGSVPRETAVLTLETPHMRADGLHVRRAAGAGISIKGADSLVSDSTIEDVAIGVQFLGERSTAERMNIHDLNMLINTPGGNDDAGAIGFSVEAHDVTIADSTCTNCVAPSYDYGHDGGFADIWNHGDRLTIRNSTGNNVDGFLEVGGNRQDASAVDVRLIDNKVNSVGGFIWLHTEGDYAMRIGRVEARGNTIDSDSRTEILGGAIETIEFVDNTVTSTSQITHDQRPAQHRGNRYTLPEGVNVGFDLDGSESLERR